MNNRTPIVLIEDNSPSGWQIRRSGWDHDRRGSAGEAFTTEGLTERLLVSNIVGMPNTFKRDITEQTDGVLVTEAVYELVEGDGFYFAFGNDSGTLLKMKFRNGAFCIGSQAAFPVSYGRHTIKFRLDIENGTVGICSDKKYVGEFAVNGTASGISTFKLGFDEEDLGAAKLFYGVKMYKNYYVYDYNTDPDEGELSDDYVVTANGKAGARNRRFGVRETDLSYCLEAAKGSDVTVVRPFAQAAGQLVMDIKYLLRDENGELSVSLSSGGQSAVTLRDAGRAIFTKDGVLKTHSFDVWQTLRTELDFKHKTALVRLNGKTVTVLPFENGDISCVDQLEFFFRSTGEAASEAYLGELFVFPKPVCADYVPEPVIPKKQGSYVVGMNVCSLWRTGSLYGWDCITPYEDNKPLLGYYDEGLPETADWEIKFLAEHGVDFELYCWYSSQNEYPMRSTPYASAIYNGHFLAKYSDKVKLRFCGRHSRASG